VYQDFGLPPRDDEEGGCGQDERSSGVHVANLVPDEAHESRDLARQFTHALELIGKKLPLLADHLRQRMSTPLRWLEEGTHNKAWKYDKAWRYADDETSWIFGSVWDFDGSNLFAYSASGSGGCWRLRFGEHECTVPESDGMWILDGLLRNAGKELNADEVCNEGGVSPPHSPEVETDGLRNHLIEFAERAKEFNLQADRADWEDVEIDMSPDSHDPRVATSELLDELKAVLVELKADAKESYAVRALKEKGISRVPKRLGAKDDFRTIVAKVKRCEKLIADLQQWQGEEGSRYLSRVTEQDQLNEAMATRSWIIRSVNEAIEEIGKRDEVLGAYFKGGFRAGNGRFVLTVDSKWNVD
jgi:hypothetical protein